MNKSTALLLIDIQKGLDQWDYYGGNRNNHNAEQNASIILDQWRAKEFLIIHIKHNSLSPESPLHQSHQGNAIKDEVLPTSEELVISKNVNSGFIGTNLDQHLKSKGIKSLIMAGLTTNHCVSSTARMGSNLGYHVTVISDATAAFDQIGANGTIYNAEIVHQISLANLKDEFAQIQSTQNLLK